MVLQTASAGESADADQDAVTQQEDAAEPDPQAAPEEGATASTGEVRAAEEYWTEERVAAAEELETPEIDIAEVEAAADPSQVLPPQSAPGTVPDGGDVTEAADAEDGPLSLPVAERWHGQGEMPARTTGRIYYTRPDGVDSWCSASVITSENENMVWTAGHCIHDGESGPDGFYSNIMYVPDHDNGDEPHGRWHYRYVNTSQGWSREGDLTYDYAAIALAPQDENGTVEGHLGAQGYDFGGGRDFDDVHALSYPAVGYERDDFTGEHLWYCQGPTTEDRGHVRMACDMRSGSSGSPWLRDLNTDSGTGYLIAAHSYSLRDSDGNILNEFTYASPHADGAIALYNNVAEY